MHHKAIAVEKYLPSLTNEAKKVWFSRFEPLYRKAVREFAVALNAAADPNFRRFVL